MNPRHKEIELPSGTTAVIKKYLNAREAQDIELAQQGNFEMGIDMANLKNPSPTIKPVTLGDVERIKREVLVKTLVVAFGKTADGTDNEADVYDRVMDGTPEDYAALIDACEKIAGQDPSEPKESNSGGATSAEEKSH